MKDIDKLDEISTLVRLKRKELDAVCEQINFLNVRKTVLEKEIKKIEEEDIPKLGFFDTCKIKEFVVGKEFLVVSEECFNGLRPLADIGLKCDKLYFCNENEVCLSVIFKRPIEFTRVCELYDEFYKERFPNLLMIWE